MPSAGKDKIVIVLEYYDQDVEETVAAFKLGPFAFNAVCVKFIVLRPAVSRDIYSFAKIMGGC